MRVSGDKDNADRKTRGNPLGRLSLSSMSPRRRRAALVGGVIAVLLVVLVIVPAYIATRPTYLERYPGLKPRVETWASSVHAKAGCQSCHAKPDAISQGVYAARMLGEFYLSPVMRSREPDLFKRPVNASCSDCHFDLRTVSPEGDLNIPHRAHVNVLELDCVTCHKYLVHETSPEGKHTPRMVACLTCHDGDQAENACTTCHTAKAAPESHKAADWVVVHPERQKGDDCAECHAWTERWCAECHTRRPRSHVEKWRSLHGEKTSERRNCEVCHDGPFCIECHGEVPQVNYDPGLKRVE